MTVCLDGLLLIPGDGASPPPGLVETTREDSDRHSNLIRGSSCGQPRHALGNVRRGRVPGAEGSRARRPSCHLEGRPSGQRCDVRLKAVSPEDGGWSTLGSLLGPKSAGATGQGDGAGSSVRANGRGRPVVTGGVEVNVVSDQRGEFVYARSPALCACREFETAPWPRRRAFETPWPANGGSGREPAATGRSPARACRGLDR